MAIEPKIFHPLLFDVWTQNFVNKPFIQKTTLIWIHNAQYAKIFQVAFELYYCSLY